MRAATESAVARRAPLHAAGFTLVELLVVLVILATLAATALYSTTGLVEQTRYETTRALITSLDAAILGEPGLVDASRRPWIRGFVADIGRLPLTTAPAVEGGPLGLDELFLAEAGGLPPFAVQPAPGDPEVMLPAGWRGPYLRPPPGGEPLLDGWGRPLRIFARDGSQLDGAVPSHVAVAPGAIASLGADGDVGDAIPGGSYDADLGTIIASLNPPVVTSRAVGEVPVQLTIELPDDFAFSGFVVLRLYGPSGGQVRTLEQLWFEDPDDTTPEADAPFEAGESTTLSGVLSGVPIGARALRAYFVEGDPESLAWESPLLESDAPERSRITYLTVVPGGVPTVLVELIADEAED